MVSSVEFSDPIEQEMPDHESKDRANNWCCVNSCQVAEAEVVCRNDQDRDGGVIGDGPWN